MWDESKHPRDERGRFTFKDMAERLRTLIRRYSDTPAEDFASLGLPDGSLLENEYIPRSLGAKARNYDIDMGGRKVHLAEGTYITQKEVIAGRGKPSKHIREIASVIEEFRGEPRKWSKMKGIGIIDVDGEQYKAELHWYEEPSIGKVQMKVKRQKDGSWFL